MEKEKTKTVSIRLPVAVADSYEEQAKEFGLSRSSFLALALRFGLIIINDVSGRKTEEDDSFYDDFLAEAERVKKNAVQKR